MQAVQETAKSKEACGEKPLYSLRVLSSKLFLSSRFYILNIYNTSLSLQNGNPDQKTTFYFDDERENFGLAYAILKDHSFTLADKLYDMKGDFTLEDIAQNPETKELADYACRFRNMPLSALTYIKQMLKSSTSIESL